MSKSFYPIIYELCPPLGSGGVPVGSNYDHSKLSQSKTYKSLKDLVAYPTPPCPPKT